VNAPEIINTEGPAPSCQMSQLCLVHFGEKHFPLLMSWFHDQQEVTQWAGSGPTFPITPSQLAAMVEEARTSPPRRYCWMAATNDGHLVGHAQLALDWNDGVARLARIAIAPELRGRGMAHGMLSLVLAEAFALPRIERVELNVFSWNEAAIKTYTRLGFVHEGTRRSSVRVGAERWDTVMMGQLRVEWETGRATPVHS